MRGRHHLDRILFFIVIMCGLQTDDTVWYQYVFNLREP